MRTPPALARMLAAKVFESEHVFDVELGEAEDNRIWAYAKQAKLNNLRVITMVFDLLFRVGPAIKAIFELGYEPKEELFYELTAEQYSQLEKKGNDLSKRWFTIIPEDPKLDVPELLIVDEDGKKSFLDAANYIHRFCAREQPDRQFLSFDEKLEYAASQLPTVFSQSSKYGKINPAPHLTVVK